MSWPTPQDYNEALQHPAVSFADAQLKQGIAEVNALGLPKPITGSFASVYRLHCETVDVAVRCFLHDIPDLRERYRQISNFILADDLEFTVDFEYLEKGILVAGKWYPILKMHWVDGVTLSQFLERAAQAKDGQSIDSLCHKFEDMVRAMQSNGIAHGDLQHGNILIDPGGELRLVDYDGMYVPSLKGLASNELGHRNYQHPARTSNHFGPYLDNFAGWVIYLSLRCLAIDPTLWKRANAGDDCLLFRQGDYANPTQSRILRMLERHSSVEIRKGISMFESMLTASFDELPGIEALGPHGHGAYAPPSMFDRMLWSLKSLSFSVPDWYHDLQAKTHANALAQDFDIQQQAQPHSKLPAWLDEWFHPASDAYETAPSPSTALLSQQSLFTQSLSTQSSSASPSSPAPQLPDWLQNPAPSAGTQSTQHASTQPITQQSSQQSPHSPHSPGQQASPLHLPGPLSQLVWEHLPQAPFSPIAPANTDARKHLSRGIELLKLRKFQAAEVKLIEALGLLSKPDDHLELEISLRLALVYGQHADELFLMRRIVAAAAEYEKAIVYLHCVKRLRGGHADLPDLMSEADNLFGLITCYTADGRFKDALMACNHYIEVLNRIPKMDEKLKRANNKLQELKSLAGNP